MKNNFRALTLLKINIYSCENLNLFLAGFYRTYLKIKKKKFHYSHLKAG